MFRRYYSLYLVLFSLFIAITFPQMLPNCNESYSFYLSPTGTNINNTCTNTSVPCASTTYILDQISDLNCVADGITINYSNGVFNSSDNLNITIDESFIYAKNLYFRFQNTIFDCKGKPFISFVNVPSNITFTESAVTIENFGEGAALSYINQYQSHYYFTSYSSISFSSGETTAVIISSITDIAFYSHVSIANTNSEECITKIELRDAKINNPKYIGGVSLPTFITSNSNSSNLGVLCFFLNSAEVNLYLSCSSTSSPSGGCIYISDQANSNVTLLVDSSYTSALKGGTIYGENIKNISISDSSFANSQSGNENGGAIYLIGSSLSTYSPDHFSILKIIRSSFKLIFSLYDGGCIYVSNFNKMIIENSQFISCSSLHSGGAMAISNINSTNIENTSFEQNSVEGFGAVILCENSDEVITSNINITSTQNYYPYSDFFSINSTCNSTLFRLPSNNSISPCLPCPSTVSARHIADCFCYCNGTENSSYYYDSYSIDKYLTTSIEDDNDQGGGADDSDNDNNYIGYWIGWFIVCCLFVSLVSLIGIVIYFTILMKRKKNEEKIKLTKNNNINNNNYNVGINNSVV